MKKPNQCIRGHLAFRLIMLAAFALQPIILPAMVKADSGNPMSVDKMAGGNPIMDADHAYIEADKLLKKLSVEEKALLVRGYNKFFIKGFEDKGMPPVYLSDATQGVNIRTNQLPDNNVVRQLDSSTAFPSPIMLASTFSGELAYEYAKAIGEECRAGGIEVLLGPGLNIYRQSQCARNFEYFGEDPFLVSQMVSNYVKGLQGTGTAACLKHFYGNNTEFYRKRSNSIIGERAMNEIYLPGFKAGIDAGAMSVMTSYNLIDGEWAGQSQYVIKELLREKLGFRWLVMSDWNSVWDLEKTIRSGQNLEMPGMYKFGEEVIDLYRDGRITEEDLDNMARPILATCIAMDFYGRNKYETSLLANYPQHEAVARRVAEEGTILLKNRDCILPLDPSVNRKILLTGKFVYEIPRGYGAAEVIGYKNVSLLDALEAVYGRTVYYVEKPTVAQLKEADVVILSMGTRDKEAIEKSFSLPKEDESFMRYVTKNNPNTVAVINTGSAIDMSMWNDNTAALIYGWYGGQSGFEALADIISGKISPSGKLPVTLEKSFRDSPAYGYLPKGAQLYSELRNEQLIGVYDVEYKEDILVGYRWYDTKGIEPLYPFGFGLSYTEFGFGKMKASSRRISGQETVTVSIPVTNTGKTAGAEVLQLYVSEANPTVLRPAKELKAFSKVYLQPGEKTVVELTVSASDFAYWDDVMHDWNCNSGEYVISVGNSSRNIISEVRVVKE